MSGTSLEATVVINAAPAVVRTAFQAIEEWPTWYPGVVAAEWLRGLPWQPESVMQIAVKNSLGMLVKSNATVLPAIASPTSSLRDVPTMCWENHALGLVTLCYAWTEAVNGGCRFTLQKFYRGATVPLLYLLKGRQTRMLQAGLGNLCARIYAEPRT